MPSADPTDDDGADDDATYVAGKGTSRERRLPLMLGRRAQWTGAGAGAALNEARLCPYCHVQNEQLWQESIGAGARTPADVRSTLSRFDRVMSILTPRRGGGGGRGGVGAGRARRRKNGASGRTEYGQNFDDGDAHRLAGDRLSTSAPSSTDEGGALLLRRAMNGLGVGHGTGGSAREEAELREELASAARLGHRRRRRWANDRLLRELGGRMSVAEMQAQFMPPPFGAPAKPTAFEAMLDAQARGEWTGFHKVDMDKEKAFLDKVRAAEAASRTHRHESESYAAAGWARTSARARAALRSVARRSPERLEDLENVVLDFAEEFADTARELVLPLDDGFGRLLAHGLCEFHGVAATSRPTERGGKELVVRAPSVASISGRDPEPEEGDDDDEAAAGESSTEPARWRAPSTCAEFLRLLERSGGAGSLE
tara:strand:- start:5269 stop:6552 length:1284 start_codon:yes stop_codon:yes gene_type:complete